MIDGGARAAVGLQHVAVERDGALAERAQVHDRAQRAADQALDLEGAAALLAARGLARAMRVWVARGSMPYSAVTQPSPLPRRNDGTPSSTLAVHQHPRVAELDQHRALRVARVAAGDANRAQLVGRAAAGSHVGPPFGQAPSQRTAAAVVLSA